MVHRVRREPGSGGSPHQGQSPSTRPGSPPEAFPWASPAGPDGNLWFTEFGGDRIGRITPSGTVTEYSAGITAGSDPNDITTGPDGNLWFTEYAGNRIGRITPAGVVTEYSAGITNTSFDITAGPDGNLWFTEAGGDQIGRITPGGVVTEFSTGITADSGPTGITAGPDGNLWFAETYGNQIGRISPSGTITEYSTGITANSRPTGITAGPDGNLWFTQPDTNQIGRISPSGTVTEYASGISSIKAPRTRITAGPDGNIWFSEYVGGRIGRINLRRAVTRLAGVDRIGTCDRPVPVELTPPRAARRRSCSHRADAFPDALTGAALAAAKHAPLLLTAPDSLDPRTAAEIRRVLGPDPKTVYVLGGTAALSAAVAASVGGLGYPVVRFAGTDRYDTAAIVASAADGLDDLSTILLATGTNFPDGLCAGSGGQWRRRPAHRRRCAACAYLHPISAGHLLRHGLRRGWSSGRRRPRRGRRGR